MVASDLVAWGFAESQLRKDIAGPQRLPLTSQVLGFVALGVLVTLLGLFFIGVMSGAKTVWNWLH